MVDRITSATSPGDRLLVARTQGYEDASPVPTEPFSEWVISGSFPAGRPAWHESGARIVAADGSRKLPIRILPTLREERAAGRMPIGCATVIAAWILHLRGHGTAVKDPAADAARAAAAVPDLASAVRGVLGTWDHELPSDADLVETIKSRLYVVTDSP